MTDENPSNLANNHQPNLDTPTISQVTADSAAKPLDAQPVLTGSKPQTSAGQPYQRLWLLRVLAITVVLSLISWLGVWLSGKLLTRLCNPSNSCGIGYSIIGVYDV